MINCDKSWNPVLNKFVEIKEKFIQMFDRSQLYHYNDTIETCLDYWVRNLGIQEYLNLIEPLELNEYEGKLLIRYGRYCKVYADDDDATPEDFWDRYDGFYQECRSVVINVRTDELILVPFKKFFNLNERPETSLENVQSRIRSASVVELSDKLDGSMQSVRWYKDGIIMAGAQALDPENSWRLQDGLRMLYQNPAYGKMMYDSPNYTFVFEYISQKDAHVVKYAKEQEGMYLIGIRSVETGFELDY